MSLRDLACSFAGAVLDPTSTPACVVVPPSLWRSAAERLRDAGATRAEWLTAADFGDCLRLVIFVRSQNDHLLLATDLADDCIETLCGIWPGLHWHERECAEMFAITFEGLPDSRRLLLAGLDVDAPLRRRTPLAPRLSRTWPGSVTASGVSIDAPARGRRAVGLPPGVLQQWHADMPSQGDGESR